MIDQLPDPDSLRTTRLERLGARTMNLLSKLPLHTPGEIPLEPTALQSKMMGVVTAAGIFATAAISTYIGAETGLLEAVTRFGNE